MVRYLRSLVSVAAIAISTAAAGQGPPVISDFLATIGGDTSKKTRGALTSVPQLYPLRDDASEIIGYRLFSEKLTENGSATAERAKAAYAQECAAKGGQLEPPNSEVDATFRDHVLGNKIPTRGGFKHFWVGISAVCSRGADQVLGGFVAITFDNTEVATKGELGSRLISRIALEPTRTAVYAYWPGGIRSRAWFEAIRGARLAREDVEEHGREVFRRELEIGSDTNCGTVIQLRGPMVELAVPPSRLSSGGPSSFWAKRATLEPRGMRPCTIGP